MGGFLTFGSGTQYKRMTRLVAPHLFHKRILLTLSLFVAASLGSNPVLLDHL